MNFKPLVTIVTINLNNLAGLKKTANSIPNDNEVEWIFIDGVSNDGSIEFINQFNRKPDQLLIEKDLGIYDAMNKGIELANGKFTWFMNSGDLLYSDFDFSNFKLNLRENENVDLFYCDYILDNNGSTKRVSQNYNQLDLPWMFSKTLNHQSYLLKTEYLKKIKFNLEYKIIADWIQLFESFRSYNLIARYFPYPIVIYDRNGFSFLNEEKRLIERDKYLKSKYSKWELDGLLIFSRIRNRKYYFALLRNFDSLIINKIILFVLKFRNLLRK
jgi:hypothetical protein